jgi:dipeptidyl aminopeptidase/acylaminoacyl peptidase
MRNSIQGDWGGKDFDDLIEGINFLTEQGIIDSERMGIMGWSYGGFMTANAITKTDKFKAASVGGALINFVSYAGTTDIPHFLPHYMNGWFWNNPQTWKDHSPIEHIANVKTPTLIQHSSGDKRVPVSQAFELYSALKYQGIPTKFILYTDSGHSLSNPKVIIEGIQHNLDWFNFWIQPSKSESQLLFQKSFNRLHL